MRLFKDQERIIKEIMLNLDKNNLIISPSGSGKTYMISQITKNLIMQDKKVIIIVPTNVVQEQTYNLLKLFGVYAPVETSLKFISMKKLKDVDFIIVDEAHHSEANIHKDLFNKFPKAKRIGFTATPVRLDGKNLGNSFDNVIQGLTVKELISLNRLSPFKYYAPNLNSQSIPEFFQSSSLTVDNNSFYIQNKQNNSYNTEYKGVMFGDVINTYKKIAKNKQAILFAQSIEQSKEFALAFKRENIKCDHIDGYMSFEERKKILDNFRKGKIQVICNFNLISEGFDMNDCEVVILARRTLSLALYLQQVFRALRYKKDKEAIILDHANNIHYHNQIDMERYWDLNIENKKKDNSNNYPSNVKKPNLTYIFDESIELEDISNSKNPKFEKEVKEALEKEGFESFKALVQIQTTYNIISTSDKSWAYTMATHYNKLVV